MIDEQAIDARLSALLGGGEPEPDERFVTRVERAVLADQRLQAARRAAWQRFGRDLAASGAVVLAFALLWNLGPDVPLDSVSLAPSLAAVALLALWFIVELRPSATQN